MKGLKNDHLFFFNQLEEKGFTHLSGLMRNLYGEIKKEKGEGSVYSIKHQEAFHIINEFITLLNGIYSMHKEKLRRLNE